VDCQESQVRQDRPVYQGSKVTLALVAVLGVLVWLVLLVLLVRLV
jgi:hypothetical protein